jgi:hypothetical protein
MRHRAALVIAVALLGGGVALAQPYPANGPPGAHVPLSPPAPIVRTYGKKVALVDALSLGAIVVGMALLIDELIDDGDPDDVAGGVLLVLGGGAGYVLGGPIVHASEGNRPGAWKSLGVRLGLPLAGSLIAAAARPGMRCEGDVCSQQSNGPLDSLPALGVIGAMMIDWFVLARVEVSAPALLPYAAPTRHGGATVGLGGSF